MKNKYKVYLWIAYIMGFFGIVVSLAPEIIEHKRLRYEGLIILVGLFIALSAWLTALIVFKEKARIVDDILGGENMVARWTYKSSEWKQKIMEDSENSTMRSISMLVLLLIIISVIFIPVIVMYDMTWPLYVYIAFWILFSMAMVINIRRIRYMKERAYVILGRDGAIINDQIDWWRGRGRDFEEAYYDEVSKSIVIIYFNYFKKGSRRNIITIPVPNYADIDIESAIDKIEVGQGDRPPIPNKKDKS